MVKPVLEYSICKLNNTHKLFSLMWHFPQLLINTHFGIFKKLTDILMHFGSNEPLLENTSIIF